MNYSFFDCISLSRGETRGLLYAIVRESQETFQVKDWKFYQILPYG